MNASNGNYILTNGFIQPAEYIIQTPQKNPIFFNNTEISSANIRIFPNPTQDIIAVDFSQAYTGKINLQLFDEHGHIIYTKDIPTYGLGFIEKINMKALPSGAYMLFIKQLNIVSGKYDSITGSYKIIKL